MREIAVALRISSKRVVNDLSSTRESGGRFPSRPSGSRGARAARLVVHFRCPEITGLVPTQAGETFSAASFPLRNELGDGATALRVATAARRLVSHRRTPVAPT